MTRVGFRLAAFRAIALASLLWHVGSLGGRLHIALSRPVSLYGFRTSFSVWWLVYWISSPLASIFLASIFLRCAPRFAALEKGPSPDAPASLADRLRVFTILAGLVALDRALSGILPFLTTALAPAHEFESFAGFGAPRSGEWWMWAHVPLAALLAIVLLIGPARAGASLRRTFVLTRADATGT